MNKDINLKRLSLALGEFWLMNRTKLLSIPVVTLLLLVIYYLWYNTPLLNHLVFNMYPTEESFLADMGYYRNMSSRVFVLFLLPVYLIVCAQPYLKKLNSSVRTTMTPFTQGERLITLWAYTLLIIVVSLGSFIAIDALLIQLLKSSYLDSVVHYMESQGDLYPEFREGSYFAHLTPTPFYVFAIISVIGAAIYYLATLFFKRLSIIKFLAILVVFIVILVNVVLRFHEMMYRGSVTYTNVAFIPWGLYILISLIVLLLIVTTYYKLKEKEV